MPTINSADLIGLVHLHLNKRLLLTTSRGLSGVAHLDGDPDALVSEILRLAKLGADLELVLADDASTTAAPIADGSAAWWGRNAETQLARQGRR